MNSKKYFTICSSILVVGLILMLKANSNVPLSQYKLASTASYIRLAGTSTMHDWEAEAGKINGELNAEINKSQILKFTALDIEVTAESIKTDKHKMDVNMHKELKTVTFPKISFKLKDHSIERSMMSLTGDLTAAGITKSIKITTNADVIGNELQLKGNFNVKMTDFNIKPPVLFFGALKTADMVTLKFLLVFKKTSY